MRVPALLVASLVGLIGLTGVALPGYIALVETYVATPVGLAIVAVLRVAVGFILLKAAPASRYPRILRVLGPVIIIAGFATPLFGVERSRAMLDWWSGLGPGVVRMTGGLAIAAGGFLAYAVSSHRPPPSPMAIPPALSS